MTAGDLDTMTTLLSDPEVMRYYPTPKTRQDAANWIVWNERNYAEHGFGLWIVELHDGTFVGDCGLTIQYVDGERYVEIGYHVMPAWHGRGLATEAAGAVREAARDDGISHLIAIIRPLNLPSQRVAEKIGLHLVRRATVHDLDCVVYGTDL